MTGIAVSATADRAAREAVGLIAMEHTTGRRLTRAREVAQWRHAHPARARRLARSPTALALAQRGGPRAGRVADRARLGAARDHHLRAPHPAAAADRVGGRPRLPLLRAD